VGNPRIIELLDAIDIAHAELEDLDKGPTHERRDQHAYRYKGVVDEIRRARKRGLRTIERRYYDGIVYESDPHPSGRTDCEAHAEYLTSLGFTVTTRLEAERLAVGIGDWGQYDQGDVPQTTGYRDAYIMDISW
jgi:hypothetical protein